jgi:energy-dependent translational throttle protein EttA
VRWHGRNYQSHIESLKRRNGADADQPHRIAFKKLVRA